MVFVAIRANAARITNADRPSSISVAPLIFSFLVNSFLYGLTMGVVMGSYSKSCLVIFGLYVANFLSCMLVGMVAQPKKGNLQDDKNFLFKFVTIFNLV